MRISDWSSDVCSSDLTGGGDIMKTRKTVAFAAASSRSASSPTARRKHFVEVLAQTATVTESATQAGLDRSAVSRLRARSSSFLAAWDEAMTQDTEDM